MRKLTLLVCSLAAAAAVAGSAGAADPNSGTLSVERGRGVVILELRGSVLGRIANGSLRVTDLTPRDRFGAMVVGRRLTEERIGPKTVLYRGQGLSFRMHGGHRLVVRGNGISLSAVGRGSVSLDGEPRVTGEDVGVYSIDGTDCWVLPLECTPVPLEAERFVIGPPPEEGGGGRVPNREPAQPTRLAS
jgi:hypothetical protein